MLLLLSLLWFHFVWTFGFQRLLTLMLSCRHWRLRDLSLTQLPWHHALYWKVSVPSKDLASQVQGMPHGHCLTLWQTCHSLARSS